MNPKVLCMVAVSACVLSARTAEQPSKSALVQGIWTYVSPKTILGEGSDITITLKADGDQWTITRQITRYPSVNDRQAKVTTERKGPFPVTVDDHELVVKGADGKPAESYTFLCDERRLILPAIVQKKPGEWFFRYSD